MSDLSVWLAQQSKSEREYLLKHQPRNFVEGLGNFNRYYRWVTDFGFIEAKLDLSGVQALIEDFDLARNADVLLAQEQRQTLKLIQGAIRKSAHVLDKDKTQLAGQLLGRLLDFEMPQIQAMLEQGRQSKDSVWLRPVKANLERANEGALRTLAGHTESVYGVAIAPDGLTAISASSDKTLKIWDIKTGTELLTLTGHSSFVSAVAIAPDGLTAISGSHDDTLKIWDLLSGKEIASFSGEHEFNCYAISPDGVTVVAGDDSGRVHFLRLEGMKHGHGREMTMPFPYKLNNPVTLFYEGLLLAKQGQYEAALPKLTEVAKVRPDVAVVWFELGKILDNLQRYEEAIASFDKAIEIERERENRKFWFDRGLALMKCGSQDAARTSWKRAMSIEPDDSDFWIKKGTALCESECYEPAICCFDLALQIQPNQFCVWERRGIALRRAGRNEEAISNYDRALELKPNDSDVLCNQSNCLIKLGRYEEAMDKLDKALEIKPNDADIYYRKSNIYRLQGNYKLFYKNYSLAIQFDPYEGPDALAVDPDAADVECVSGNPPAPLV